MHRFTVDDMTCGHCSATVEKAVKAVDSTASVTIDRTAGRVTVDGLTDAATISAAIEAAGYKTRRLES